MIWTQIGITMYLKGPSYLLRCCVVSLRYFYCPKKQSERYFNSFIPRPIPSFSNGYFVRCEKGWIPNLLWITKSHWGVEVSHVANKDFPLEILNSSLRYVELNFHKMLTGKWWYFGQVRNPGFKIFFYSGFSDGYHCLKLPFGISKDSFLIKLWYGKFDNGCGPTRI